MSPLERIMLTLGLCCVASVAQAATPVPQDFGKALPASDVARYLAVPPNGAGLPAGHGTATDGATIFAEKCAACHGDKLQGIAATGAPALVGGRGTLKNPKPVKTVESYWPYATTVFDYVRRAMPFNAPGTLSDDEVYALTAYILAQGHVIDASATMDAHTLPAVAMPNKDGFFVDPRPRSP